MITMTMIAPKLINTGCSCGVWGVLRGVPDPAEPGGLGRVVMTRVTGESVRGGGRAGDQDDQSENDDHGALQPVYV
jgi:hypothetical protein